MPIRCKFAESGHSGAGPGQDVVAPKSRAGTDVMITIFGDFWQLSAKKLAFFSKTNVMIKIFQNLALFWVKNANFFAEFFGENILKIITSVPGLDQRMK
jgi:hypothetical protein